MFPALLEIISENVPQYDIPFNELDSVVLIKQKLMKLTKFVQPFD
jgi:hypothetical protein